MKNLLLISLLLTFLSCGKDDPAQTSCDNSKQLFSVWTSQLDGVTYDFTTASYNTTLQVKAGPVCNDAIDDFSIYITPDGRMGFSNCADTTSYGGASYKLVCNTLMITYDSDGSVESFK